MLRLWLGSILIVAACLAGCGKRPPPLPTTYPVRGKVAYRDGTLLGGGMVQFVPEGYPEVTTSATINPDGTYSLTTMRDGLRAEGAVAGANRVMVIPPPGLDVKMGRGVVPTIYPNPYNVESRDNKFDLTAERP
jgi:hypothetical protein